jgi:hypothetical protein
MTLTPSLTWSEPIPDGNARARELLDQSRSALGGESALNSIQSLVAAGDFRSGSDNTLASGEVELDILLPEKLMRTMKWSPIQDLKAKSGYHTRSRRRETA